jgi:hypothetical protein
VCQRGELHQAARVTLYGKCSRAAAGDKICPICKANLRNAPRRADEIFLVVRPNQSTMPRLLLTLLPYLLVSIIVSMPITERDFRQFARQRLSDAFVTPSLFGERLKEVLDFAVANESAMDDGAKAYYDKLLDGISTMFEQGLAGIADSPDKRKMLRLVALTKQKHHRAENFLKGLGRPLPVPFSVSEAGRPIFLDTVQSVLDLLFDATREGHHGVAQFASLSMLYWSVDELTVAFYLTERKYTTQAYSHLRTVHDLLDKAELFFREPQLAEVWGSGDRRKILKELQPGAVRTKLGKPKFDPIYDFFTERGMHGTFGAVRQRAVQRDKSQGSRSFAIWLGGVAWDQEVDLAVSSSILSALLTLTTVAKVYQTRLHDAEVASIIKIRADAAADFLQKHLVQPLRESKTEVPGLADAVTQLLASKASYRAGETCSVF